MEYNSADIKIKGKQRAPVYKMLVRQLKQENDRSVDTWMHAAHEEAFEEIKCLSCANCCKTTSPVFTEKDVDRIAGFLKIRPGNFITSYLRRDEDGDLVLQSSPCTFLQADNSCRIYAQRPAACRTYPHTDRKKVRQLMDLTLKNSLICPAVQHILDKVTRILRIG